MIHPLDTIEITTILCLNNAYAVETSSLEAEKLRAMTDGAFCASAIGDLDAFLIAFDQDARYEGTNFAWFRRRIRRFVYVDRVITASEARGKGRARALYHDLFARAVAAGHHCIACEVNSDPPNPGSDAFHAALGFGEVGSAFLDGNGKTVRYLTRTVA